MEKLLLQKFWVEWSKSEKEKQISYINTYVWMLEMWYWWIYLQCSNKDSDIENRLVETMGTGEGGAIESSTETRALPYVDR